MRICKYMIRLRVKNRYPKWNPGTWRHGPKPAVPGGLILTQTDRYNCLLIFKMPENALDPSFACGPSPPALRLRSPSSSMASREDGPSPFARIRNRPGETQYALWAFGPLVRNVRSVSLRCSTKQATLSHFSYSEKEGLWRKRDHPLQC